MVTEGARRLRVGLELSRGIPMRITVTVVLTGISAEGNVVLYIMQHYAIIYCSVSHNYHSYI